MASNSTDQSINGQEPKTPLQVASERFCTALINKIAPGGQLPTSELPQLIYQVGLLQTQLDVFIAMAVAAGFDGAVFETNLIARLSAQAEDFEQNTRRVALATHLHSRTKRSS